MKQLKFFLFIFVFGMLILVPYNTKALENKVVSCDYQFTNSSGNDVKLEYKVYSDGTVKKPFSDGSLYADDGVAWYHSDRFSTIYYNAAKLNSSTITCPSIYVQDTEYGVTVYPYPLNSKSCTGRCYNISAATPRLSKWAEDTGIKVKKVLSTCTGSSMGFYNRKSYVLPYFRLYSDGTKEWSVDGEIYVPVTNAITGTVDDERFSITINDSLIASIFSSSKTTCPSQIYRCVTKSKNGYSYELSANANYCTKDDLGDSDGQGYGSGYFGGAFGDPTGDNSGSSGSGSSGSGSSGDSGIDHSSGDYYNQPGSIGIDELRDEINSYNPDADCNSLLGSTQNEESVAWLLQQLLNYVKILGPILVVILSSLDFAKAIIASDDDNMKKAERKLMIRLILAVALFLIPTLVSVLLNIFGITTDQICGLK